MKQTLPVISTAFLLIISLQLFAQIKTSKQAHPLSYFRRTVIIQGKKYDGFLTRNGFQLRNSKNKIYLKHAGDYFDWKFKDFNKDGYGDIFLDNGGNIPERYDLLMYHPKTKSFGEVKDFEKFPDPKNIKGTKYFYSYYRNGCADMDWGSDLFYIKNFTAIRIANISGYECETIGKKGIYISKMNCDSKIPLKRLPIKTIHYFKNGKWGFIQKYWTKNYKLFL